MHDGGHGGKHGSSKHGSHGPHWPRRPPGAGHHAHGDNGQRRHGPTLSGTYPRGDSIFPQGEGCPKRGGTAECPGECGTCPNH